MRRGSGSNGSSICSTAISAPMTRRSAATERANNSTMDLSMEDAMRRILLAIVLTIWSVPAFCQTTGHRQITMVRTGWNGDFFAVVTTEDSVHPDQFMNPFNCPVKDGYVSANTSPGYSTYYAAALTAYSLG